MTNKDFTKIAMIAAIYTVVSLVLAPFSYGNIQVRIAEALTVLPLLYKPSLWGITLGCFLTNLLGAMLGVNPTGFLDAIVGTAATFMAGYCTILLKDKLVKNVPVYALAMPVLFNAVIVGIELAVLYFPATIVTGALICGFEVGVGELISVIIGWFMVKYLAKTKLFA